MHAVFAPLTLPSPPSEERSASGVPGPAYWQNRADYQISATIETQNHVLRGSETITYTNNGPDALNVVWLQLDQNIYRKDARASLIHDIFQRRPQDFTDGDVLESVSVLADGSEYKPAALVEDTRLQLRLARPLAQGGKLKLRIGYHYTIPGAWGGRTAVSSTKNGEVYEIAQWYPRMAVYDDLRGWNTEPYLGSEFFLEYGDFDYDVTVPSDFIVAGSGALSNPEQVLSPEQNRRLAHAAESATAVMIRSAEDVATAAQGPRAGGTKTWRFHMENTRDVVFAASPAFIWDAARIDLPAGRHALAMSLYPVEAAGPGKWGRSTEFTKFAVEYFSQRWFPYPWPVMINLGGHGASMEYPGMLFDDMHDAGKDLFWITTHEAGHSWFPMIVGSNERRDAWMDEGFNTFIDIYASDAFNRGEFAPKRDSEYAEKGGNPADEILPILADPKAPIILTPPDVIGEAYRHPISYFKPALGLVLLRERILGPERFDAAFKYYIQSWAYKHPSPSDFFRLMNSEAGEDLSWWWRGWYFSNMPMNVTLDGAAYVDGDFHKGLRIQVSTHASLVMPATLRLRGEGGAVQNVTLPVEAFFGGSTANFIVQVPAKVTDVILDPENALPNAAPRGQVIHVH